MRQMNYLRIGSEQFEIADPKARSVFVNPYMYGAIGDGVADDTLAFKQLVNSGIPFVILEGDYKLTEKVFCDASYVEANSGTFVNDNFIVSDELTKGNFCAMVQEERTLASVGLSGYSFQSAVLNTDTGNFILGGTSGSEAKLVEINPETWTIVNEKVANLWHCNDLTYSSKTKKYYCAPLHNVGEIIEINSDLTVNRTITVDVNNTNKTCSQISYDEDNEVFYISAGTSTFVYNSDFTRIKDVILQQDDVRTHNYRNISSVDFQGSTVFKGQFVSCVWLFAGYGGVSYTRLVNFDYKTGSFKQFYDFPMSIPNDEPEAILEYNGKIYLFSYTPKNLQVMILDANIKSNYSENPKQMYYGVASGINVSANSMAIVQVPFPEALNDTNYHVSALIRDTPYGVVNLSTKSYNEVVFTVTNIHQQDAISGAKLEWAVILPY